MHTQANTFKNFLTQTVPNFTRFSAICFFSLMKFLGGMFHISMSEF